MELEDLRKIERKWQRKWKEAKIFEANPDLSKPKFFITVPYPYTSGSLHIGHGRTYTIGDIIARWKRLMGYNVLFPMAFHITGTPILSIADRIATGDEKYIKLYRWYLSLYEKDPKKIESLIKSFKDPKNVAEYFASKIQEDFEALGYSIDWRRKFHTGEPIYNAFVRWQYYKLREKGVITRGVHFVRYCLLHQNPAGEDDIADADVNPVRIIEFVAIKFKYDDGYILAATLRPETIFGATNMWVNPNAKYAKIEYDGEILYMSNEASVKFIHQYPNATVIERDIPGETFVGKYVIDPLGKKLLILPAEFVDPDNATGFVYSEPSDAPYDYVALMEAKKKAKEISKKYGISPEEIEKISLIKIIDVPGIDGHHAEIIVKEMKITSQLDPRLEEATKVVYKEQYYHGIMNENAGEFAGLPVSEAKEKVKEWLISQRKALIFYETSRKAWCRSGGKIIIARVKDQWFIDYSKDWWKDRTKEHIQKMLIYPEKYRQLFLSTVDWLERRPCARRRGLGTRLPFDKRWIIESLSDSTIYMAFYTIAHHIRQNNIDASKLIPEVFDYIFLGRGDPEDISSKTGVASELLEKMRKEFEYWYPVDVRHTAIAHITNHLTFYIMHHIAIFPEKHWPRAITLNELVIREGAKMSKSKGNIIPLKHIAEKYSADLFRLYVAASADLDTILDWREKDVTAVRNRLLKFAELALKAISAGEVKDFGSLVADRWILSRFYERIIKGKDLMENFKIKDYTVSIFFEMLKDLNYYERRTNTKRLLWAIRQILHDWIIALSPIIPHICEEVWEQLGEKGFVSLAKYPEISPDKIDKDAIQLEEIIRRTVDDAKNILITIKQKPTKMIIILASEFKRNILRKVREICKERFEFKVAMRALMKDEKFRKHGKEIAFILQQIAKDPTILSLKVFDMKIEKSVFEEARKFLSKEFNCDIEILTEEEAKKRNYVAKAKIALPGKPGILFT